VKDTKKADTKKPDASRRELMVDALLRHLLSADVATGFTNGENGCDSCEIGPGFELPRPSTRTGA
jgi:hypothetical protein